MADLIDDLGDPDRSPGSRLFTRTAHLLPWAVAAIYPVRVLVDVAPETLPAWLTLASGFVILPVFLFATIHQEFARICVRCMREVPANTGRAVTRLRWMLAVSHWRPRRYYALWVPMFVIGTVAVTIGGVGWSWVFLGCDTLFCITVMAGWVHHRLRPWCPFCRRWDDGQGPHELVPDPDPAGVKSA